jgi:hypothetical protein
MAVSDELQATATLLPGQERLAPNEQGGCGSRGGSGRFGEEKNTLPLSGIERRYPGCPTRSVVFLLIMVSRLVLFECTVELHLTGRFLTVSPVIRIGLALRVNFSRILQN